MLGAMDWLRLSSRRLRWIRLTPDMWVYYKGGASIQRLNADRRRSLRSYLPRVTGSTMHDPPAMSTLAGAQDLAESLLQSHRRTLR